MKASDYCLVYVTVGSEAQAQQIAQALLLDKLAACVNCVGPMQSTYVWQGEIQADSEFLLMIKTRQSLFETLSQRVSELHSYELPEIIAVPLSQGLPAYLQWIQDSTKELE